jgi:hypothetical protein
MGSSDGKGREPQQWAKTEALANAAKFAVSDCESRIPRRSIQLIDNHLILKHYF